MDLTTRYLGLDLANPFIPGASPLANDLDVVMRLEDAGAPAIVMPSLFEEDVVRYDERPNSYLEQLLRIKRRVGMPVIASLNGTTPDRWLRHARLIERGGADALELNFYHVATDMLEAGAAVERRVVDIVAVLKESIRIPLAVKLSPFYSSIPNLAAQLDAIGADGLVVFNRFYQPDFDPEHLETTLALDLSEPSELRLRLRWLAILSGRVKASLAVTGGVHEPIDAVKAVMAGAHGVQVVSALLRRGPGYLSRLRDQFNQWGDAHGYDSVREMRGSMDLTRSSSPQVFERGNYIRMLQSGAWPAAH
jgi:dihydroorotate dehydrogenase (fumarate)